MKPPPTPMIGGKKADAGAEAKDRNGADEELRRPEAHFQRQLVDPVVLSGLLEGRRCAGARPPHGAHAFDHHQPADGAEQCDIEQRDEEVELAYASQQREDIGADGRAKDAACKQHRAELEIERAALQMRQCS